MIGIGHSYVTDLWPTRCDKERLVENMIIEIPLDPYDRLLAQCDPASREYEILKNGLIVRHSKDGHYERVVEILSEMQDAKLLLALAQKICPDAVPAIAKAISKARDI